MSDDLTHQPPPEDPELILGLFTDLADAQIIPPKWLVRDLLPVGVTLLIGPPKDSQKSTLAEALALMVSGHHPEALPKHMAQVDRAGVVMMFSSEASAGVLKHMAIEGLRTHPERGTLYVADDPGKFRLDDEDCQLRMERWLNHFGPRMVVVDVLRDFHSLDEKDSAGMNALLRWIRDWAHANEAAALIVHHTRKLAEGQERYSSQDARGSGALFGLADGILVITPQAEDWKLVSATFKRGESWERTVRFGTYGQTAAEYVSDEDQKVLQAVKAGIPTVEEIAKQAHVAKARVVEAMKRLERNGLLKKNGRKREAA